MLLYNTKENDLWKNLISFIKSPRYKAVNYFVDYVYLIWNLKYYNNLNE
jgi:hypothetical protein